MKDDGEIKVRDVEEGLSLGLTLNRTVLSVRIKNRLSIHFLDIPVECLKVVRKKRFNAVWLAAFLLALVLGLLAGIPLALLASKAVHGEWAVTAVGILTIGSFLLPALYFLCFRMWRRDAVVELIFGEGKNAKLSFWMPLKQARRERVEALLSDIEAVRPEVSGCDDHAVVEDDEKASHLGALIYWLRLLALFSIPAVVFDRPVLLWLLGVPMLGAAVTGIRWLRKPKVLREALRHMQRSRWEEALRCFGRFDAEDPSRKGEFLLERLGLLRRLGRFGEASELLDSHLSVIGPEAHRALTDELAVARRVRQRKYEHTTGGWFLAH